MASGARAIGLIALGLVVAPIGAVAWRAGGISLSAADLSALRFTLLQSFLSAGLSVLLALPLAKALARRRFFGRNLLVSLLGAPFLLPSIVAVLGLMAIFGRSGVLNTALVSLGLPSVSIYGLQGVVLAHLFLNLPFATRMILQGWQSIPDERFRLAQSLSFSARDISRHLERPMLREVLPGAFATIFAICLTSFAVALTLGGGPAATTLELAIYQAIRFEFALSQAAGLALLQSAIGLASALAAWQLSKASGFGAGLDRNISNAAPQGWRLVLDVFMILIGAAFLILPIAALVVTGLSGLFELTTSVWSAAFRSISVALISTLLTLIAALLLTLRVAQARSTWLEFTALLPLATSGLVLGTGLFLLIQPVVTPAKLALPVTLLVNCLMALPFAYRLLLPEARALHQDFDQLSRSLDIKGIHRLRLITLPRLARPIGFAAGLTAALSMGDLGVIALFADAETATLPLKIQQLTSAYRSNTAAGGALLLMMLSFALFWIFDAGGRRVAAR